MTHVREAQRLQRLDGRSTSEAALRVALVDPTGLSQNGLGLSGSTQRLVEHL